MKRKSSKLTLTLTPETLRQVCIVHGKCTQCAGPAQVITRVDGEFKNVCFDWPRCARKATHALHGYPVTVEDRDDHSVWVTYVGPSVPGGRKLGERRLATRHDLNGKPQLIPIESKEKK